VVVVKSKSVGASSGDGVVEIGSGVADDGSGVVVKSKSVGASSGGGVVFKSFRVNDVDVEVISKGGVVVKLKAVGASFGGGVALKSFR